MRARVKASEALRGFREEMRRKLGPDWAGKLRRRLNHEQPDWTSYVIQIHDAHGRLVVEFVVLARGGFKGKVIPGGVPEE
jgi:hypothetical protein